MRRCDWKILFYFTAATVFGTLAVQTDANAEANNRPNVVVFLADDQGWGDLSLHGNTNLSTPHIDSLARDGAMFERFFVCAVCAPTRAEMLTGRYYPKTGVSGVSRGEGRLNIDEVTIGDTFKAAGYRTGAFGKWHNGTQPPYHPNDRGFDEYYGFTSGHWGLYFDPPLDHNNSPVRGSGYIVDDLTDHAIEFIESSVNEPFLCYVPYNTPHSPMQVPDRFYEKFSGPDFELGMRNRDAAKEDPLFTRAALAMCENIDWNVGRVLETLDRLKLAENTIVIYFSDNGPNSWRWNGDMKGRKGSIDEGGLRVPCLIRWPAKIDAGKTISQIAGAIDLLPTLVDLCDVPSISTKPIDGISLKPLLLGVVDESSWPPREILSFRRKAGVRTQRFRLDENGKLFDMQSDPGQRTTVNEKYSDEAQRLQRIAAQHTADMQPLIRASKLRPFTVGFGRRTSLPARDGNTSGGIERSAPAPNNSFFTDWVDAEATIVWDIDVGEDADYQAVVYYTCKPANVGAILALGTDVAEVTGEVVEAFDPPFYDKRLDRASRGSESFVKDFKPLSLGKLRLTQGRHSLVLSAEKMVGGRVVDVHSVELTKQ